MVYSVTTPLLTPWSVTPNHPGNRPWSVASTTPTLPAPSHYVMSGGRGGAPYPRTECADSRRAHSCRVGRRSVDRRRSPQTRAHAKANGKRKFENRKLYKLRKRKVCKMKRELKENPTKLDLQIAQMPPLRHSIPGEPFNIRKSEVVRWLESQPGVKQWIFDTAKDRGAIVYDKAAGTWQGVNYEG